MGGGASPDLERRGFAQTQGERVSTYDTPLDLYGPTESHGLLSDFGI